MAFPKSSDITLERTLPNNLEAERSILGAILLDDKAMFTAQELLRKEDFYFEGHRRIFEKMHRLTANSRLTGFPVTTPTPRSRAFAASEGTQTASARGASQRFVAPGKWFCSISILGTRRSHAARTAGPEA